MGQYETPSQESSVFVDYNNDEQLIQTQGSPSTTPPAEFQWQLPSFRETDRDNLSFVPDTTRSSRAEERNDMALKHVDPLRQDSDGFPWTSCTSMQTLVLDARPWTTGERNNVVFEQDNQDFNSLFGGIESSQAVAQAIQNWTPSHIHVDYNANDEQPIQPGSRQENFIGPFLTGSGEFPSMSYTSMRTPVMDASRPWTAEERNGMALKNDNTLVSQDWTDFNVSYNANYKQSILPESRQENLFDPFLTGSGELPYTSYTPVQTPAIDSTRLWTAEERNDMALEQDNLLSLDWTDFNLQRQFLFPFGKHDYLQPGNILSRLLMPSSGAADLSISSTTTAPSAQSPVTMEPFADDGIRTVGSLQIQQAAATRRKKDGIHQCPFSNCIATFTEPHNLQYHINAHLDLKPYACIECSYAANSPATLNRHRKRHQKV